MYLLIKPASGACNLRCRYCFYSDEMENREHAVRRFMSPGDFRVIAEKAIARESAPDGSGSVSFGFQGGEPTLAGLGFFRSAVDTVKELNRGPDGRKLVSVSWFIQTNGMLIDREWAGFLAENGFLTGLSMDGIPEIHDKNRVKPDGKGTHGAVMKAAKLLRDAGAEFNILTVLTGETARSGRKIYNFYKKNGFVWQQYIPCVAPLGGEDTVWTLGAARYGDFLCDIFDLWYNDVTSEREVYNREFENWVGILAGIEPEDCGMRGVCSPQYLIEADGSVYPCDFYALDEYLIGNILTDSFDEIEKKRRETGFIAASEKLPEKCLGCEWLSLCRGGCRRNRGPDGLNRFCGAYERFFPYAIERMRRLAAAIRRKQVWGQ